MNSANTEQSASLQIVPANEVAFDDLRAIFGTRGPGARCWCQRFKLARGEAFKKFPAEERADRLAAQAACGDPEAPGTAGLVAFEDGRPAGWCAVEPRSSYRGLVRNQKVPWLDRDEDRADDSVWAITCMLVRAGHRRQGLSRELAVAAVAFARSRGARAVEAYPMTRPDVISEELHVGTVPTYAAAGLRVVTRPTLRRAVMRLDF